MMADTVVGVVVEGVVDGVVDADDVETCFVVQRVVDFVVLSVFAQPVP